jgi:hypothetical protein
MPLLFYDPDGYARVEAMLASGRLGVRAGGLAARGPNWTGS